MTYKPWYRSVSIVSLLVGFAGSVANYFHANVADLLPALSANLGNYMNDTVALAGVIGSIAARCREAHAVTLTKNSAEKKAAAAPVSALAAPGAVVAAPLGAAPSAESTSAATGPAAAPLSGENSNTSNES